MTTVVGSGFDDVGVVALRIAIDINLAVDGIVVRGYTHSKELEEEMGLKVIGKSKRSKVDKMVVSSVLQKNIDTTDATLVYRPWPDKLTDNVVQYCMTGEFTKPRKNIRSDYYEIVGHRPLFIVKSPTMASVEALKTFLKKLGVKRLNVFGTSYHNEFGAFLERTLTM